MSLRHEQYRSLREARKILFELIVPKATPRVPKAVRQRASHCLRHFPFFDEEGRPMFSEDTYGEIGHDCGSAGGGHSIAETTS